MLFPDETYEDYKKRLDTSNITSATSSTTTATATATATKITSHSHTTVAANVFKNSSVSKCSKAIEKCSGGESATSTSNSSSAYKSTKDFFENIPAAKDQVEEHAKHKTAGKNEDRQFKFNAHRGDQNDSVTDNEDLSTNPIFLRTCEALIQQYRIRPDFFCQYYKAVSSQSTSASSSSKHSQTKSSSTKKIVVATCDKISTKFFSKPVQNCDKKLPSSSLPVDTTPNTTTTTSSEEVQRFKKRSAIYTLPKRRLENSDNVAAIVF
ncbi:hypothetical protein DOY81_012597, partial [Sarcophaga bullata]